MGSMSLVLHIHTPDISGQDLVSAPQLFYTYSIYFYNHARRLRLEKILYLELSRSSNGFEKTLLGPYGGFRSETRNGRYTAVSEVKRPKINGYIINGYSPTEKMSVRV
jgi:hypothetical protein